MYCPQCGKPVVEGSRYCTSCGTELPQRGLNTGGQTISTRPPVAISTNFFRRQGQTQVKSGGKIVGSGFKFNFELRDDMNQYTTSDGELIVALTQPIVSVESNLRAAQAMRKRKETIFYDVHRVEKDKFYWTVNIHRYGVRVEELVYTYSHLQPLVFGRAIGMIGPESMFLYVWFVTPNKSCLFAPSAGSAFWNA